MQCDMMQVKETLSYEKSKQWMSRPHHVIGRGPSVNRCCARFRIVFMGAHTDHMDDYDDCEWSLFFLHELRFFLCCVGTWRIIL